VNLSACSNGAALSVAVLPGITLKTQFKFAPEKTGFSFVTDSGFKLA